MSSTWGRSCHEYALIELVHHSRLSELWPKGGSWGMHKKVYMNRALHIFLRPYNYFMNPPTPSEQAAPGNGNKIHQKSIPDVLKWKSGFLQKVSIWLQKYKAKSIFLWKTNEERIMSRSFLSYQVDFRTPYKSQILRKSRKKKIGCNSILAINPLLLSQASGERG